MEKQEIIDGLKNSGSYGNTIKTAIEALKEKDITWTTEEIEKLFRIGNGNKQVKNCIMYRFSKNDTADFYRQLMERYEGNLLENEDAYHIKEMLTILNGNDVREFLKVQRDKVGYSEGLYHANSVTTAFSYLDKGFLYPRSKGAEDQTGQASDELDMRLMIYEDIFFDNVDIAHICNGSVYGPIMFVFEDSILKDARIRITQTNPCARGSEGWESKDYDERYFISISEMERAALAREALAKSFITDYGHHVTFYHTDELYLKDGLKKILIEQHRSDSEKAKIVKALIEDKLRKIGLDSVQVIIRKPFKKEIAGKYAQNYDVLWEIPKD